MKRYNSFTDNYKTYDTSKGHGSPKEWRRTFKERLTGEEAQAVMDEDADSPYTILGIKLDATQKEIKTAFMLLIKKWHPDNNPHNIIEATKMAQKIIAAYTLLKI